MDLMYIFDDLNLAIESCCPTLDQRYICCKAHPVYMSPRVKVVQRIEYNRECLEPINVELWIFDVRMVGFDLDVRIEFFGGFLRNLPRQE